jgi:hypothetical protein
LLGLSAERGEKRERIAAGAAIAIDAAASE